MLNWKLCLFMINASEAYICSAYIPLARTHTHRHMPLANHDEESINVAERKVRVKRRTKRFQRYNQLNEKISEFT